MSSPSYLATTTSPYPHPQSVTTSFNNDSFDSTSPPPLSASSISSTSEFDFQTAAATSDRLTRQERPKMSERSRSTSIIIPKGEATFQRERPVYPPDDARAMSPRRSSHDVERLNRNARKSLKDKARTLQSSLAALAERIDEVKSDHDKLESENKFLQDYIGGLTRTMSKDGIGSSSKKGKK